jgi:hypothetical protein
MAAGDATVKTDPDVNHLIDACYDYLTNKNTVLWGQGYDVFDPKRRRVAAEWLAGQIVGVVAVLEADEGDE